MTDRVIYRQCYVRNRGRCDHCLENIQAGNNNAADHSVNCASKYLNDLAAEEVLRRRQVSVAVEGKCLFCGGETIHELVDCPDKNKNAFLRKFMNSDWTTVVDKVLIALYLRTQGENEKESPKPAEESGQNEQLADDEEGC